MKIIKPSTEIIAMSNSPLQLIELAARTCYKSEDKITEGGTVDFLKSKILQSQHLSVIEHASATVRFVIDRGVSHELVRHRLAAYSQESTRYCNYSKGKFQSEITVIEPLFYEVSSKKYKIWKSSCESAERHYFQLLEEGSKPQEARDVLPNSLKTEVIMTANFREWRHVFKTRGLSVAAHPQMREVMVPLLDEFRQRIAVIFDDL